MGLFTKGSSSRIEVITDGSLPPHRWYVTDRTVNGTAPVVDRMSEARDILKQLSPRERRELWAEFAKLDGRG